MTSIDRTTLELSGLLDQSGSVGRIVASGSLLRPAEVTLEGKFLHWRGISSYAPDSRIFQLFAQLWESTDADIADFARAFGVLNPHTGRSTLAMNGRESLSRWRALSKQCSTFLLLVARLRSEGRYAFHDADIAILSTEVELFGRLLRASSASAVAAGELFRAGIGRDRSGRWVKSVPRWMGHACIHRYIALSRTLSKVDEQKRPGTVALFFMIERWIVQHGNTVMAPKVTYSKPHGRLVWEPMIDYDGRLLCYLGNQLLLLAAGNDIFICSVCHQSYVRDREMKGFRKRPKPGEQNYCGRDQCIRERNRLAAQRHRKKLSRGKKRD
jgi:hypothetical protein